MSLYLSGRIDGLLNEEDTYIIDEIKSTRKKIFDDDFAYNNEHLAQLKFYGYMYLKNNHLDQIDGQIKYLQISDYQVRLFKFTFFLRDLEVFHQSSNQRLSRMDIYIRSSSKKETTFYQRNKLSLFRISKRSKEMMAAIYQTIKDQDILYAIAPTGIGKTMASLFASIKALDHDRQKIFYNRKNTR